MSNIIIGIPCEKKNYTTTITPLINSDIENLNIPVFINEKYTNSTENNVIYEKCNLIIKTTEVDESDYHLLNDKHTIICFVKSDKFIKYCKENFIKLIDLSTINPYIIDIIHSKYLSLLFKDLDYNSNNVLIIGYGEIVKYFIKGLMRNNINITLCCENYDNDFDVNYHVLNNRNLKKLLSTHKFIINFTKINVNLLNYINYDSYFINFDNEKINNFDNFKLHNMDYKYLDNYSNEISTIISNNICNYIKNNEVFCYTIYNGIYNTYYKIHKDILI